MNQTTTTRPEAAPPPRWSSYPQAVIPALTIAALAGFGLGWLVDSAVNSTPNHGTKVLDTFTGEIDQLGISGTEGCVAGDGKRVCSVLISGLPLHAGERVRVAHEQWTNHAGNGYDMLVVISPIPTS